VVAVAILNACFMQEVSGVAPLLSSEPVDSATLKEEPKMELKEATESVAEDKAVAVQEAAIALKIKNLEALKLKDDAEQKGLDSLDVAVQKLAVKSEALKDEAAKDGASDEAKTASVTALKEYDEANKQLESQEKLIDDLNEAEELKGKQFLEEQDKQDQAGDDQAGVTEKDEAIVPAMDQAISLLQDKAEQLAVEADKDGASAEAHAAADQAKEELEEAHEDMELDMEEHQDNEENEEAEDDQDESEDEDDESDESDEAEDESEKDGASEEDEKDEAEEKDIKKHGALDEAKAAAVPA